MSGLLIHDGRRIGHRKWSIEAISSGRADGVVLSPFSSPRVARPRNPSASDLASGIAEVGGEVIFDPMTHARLLPTSNKVDLYDTWELWNGTPDVTDPVRRLNHVERVFDRQAQLGAPRLAPTVGLSHPQSPETSIALQMAEDARGLVPRSWQALAGNRTFWSSGSDLDALVGRLVALRAPVWVLTVMNDVVISQVPEMSDVEAFAGLLRSIHSLSLRSRVILTHADYSGLPAVAAGADSVGSGWDRGQRTFDPNSFKVDSDPGIRIPASYVTQGGLHAVLKRDAADAIERWNASEARRIRGAAMPQSDQAQRLHHFSQLRSAIKAVDSFEPRAARVAALRSRYASAADDFDTLIENLRRVVTPADKAGWHGGPSSALERYATDEGL